jgi:diguanylate cyclase (GGDEF)-like protein/PAS domain S-box-containing protein
LARARSSRALLAVPLLAAQWLALASAFRRADAWPLEAAAGAAGVTIIGLWVTLHYLVVRPLAGNLQQTQVMLSVCQTGIAEREMMVGVLEESGSRLRAIFNNSPNGVVVLDPDTTCPIDYNDTMPRLLGYTRSEFGSLPATRYVADIDESELRAHLEGAVRGAVEHFTATCRTRTATTFDASFTAQIVTVDGRPAVSCIVRDISQERKAEQALRLTHDKMQAMISELEHRNQERTTLTEMGGVLQACVTLDEAFAAVSRFCRRLFPSVGGALYVFSPSRSDLELAAWWEPPMGGFEAQVGPTDCWSLRRGQLYDRTDSSGNLACQHVGHDADVPYLCVPLTAQGETIGVLHLRAAAWRATRSDAATLGLNRSLITAVSDQITLAIANLRLRQTLRHQSIHDPLTGCYNRRYMEETLRREIPRAARSGKPLAVVMADLDHFKRFNDTYGHEAGDAVLAELGLLLKSCVRVSDIACRYGGEEFALVLPEAPIEGALKRLEEIRRRVSDLRVHQHDRVLGGLTLSMGLAVTPDHGSAPDDLLRAADKALYRAKQDGRNCIRVAGA